MVRLVFRESLEESKGLRSWSVKLIALLLNVYFLNEDSSGTFVKYQSKVSSLGGGWNLHICTLSIKVGGIPKRT